MGDEIFSTIRLLLHRRYVTSLSALPLILRNVHERTLFPGPIKAKLHGKKTVCHLHSRTSTFPLYFIVSSTGTASWKYKKLKVCMLTNIAPSPRCMYEYNNAFDSKFHGGSSDRQTPYESRCAQHSKMCNYNNDEDNRLQVNK